MKKLLALILVLSMAACCFAACGEAKETAETTAATADTKEASATDADTKEAAPAEEGNVIVLGTSDLTITTAVKYEKGEISEEDTDENQVAYYKSEETLVDFDVYQWAKATDETLKSAAEAEAKEYNATVEEKEINGLSVALYIATEESEGKEYQTATYMIDNGEEFVEIVFWLDGDNAQAEVDAIIATLTK